MKRRQSLGLWSTGGSMKRHERRQATRRQKRAVVATLMRYRSKGDGPNRAQRRAKTWATRFPGSPRFYQPKGIQAAYRIADAVNSRHFRRTGGRWYRRLEQREERKRARQAIQDL